MKLKFDFSATATPDQRLFSDPLSDGTRLLKRNLLFSSVVVLVAVAYGPDTIMQSFAKLPGDILLGSAGAVVFYYLVSFVISYTTEVQAWFIAHNDVISKEHLERLDGLARRMDEIRYELSNAVAHFESYMAVCDEKISPINALIKRSDGSLTNDELKVIEMTLSSSGARYQEEAKRMVFNLEPMLTYFEKDARAYRLYEKELRRKTIELRFLQYGKVFLWEGGVPVILGVISVVHVYKLSFEFFVAIFT